MTFDRIPGYGGLKERLTRGVLEGRTPHAMLFAGPEGAPVTALALAYGQYLQCQTRAAEDSCQQCYGCRQMSRLVHPEVHWLFPVAKPAGSSESATPALLIPTLREYLLQEPWPTATGWAAHADITGSQPLIRAEDARALQPALSMASQNGGIKIAYIWMAELMNVAAANSMLKIIEEPPADTVFILISHYPDQILPTILSRVQQVAIRPAEPEELALYARQVNPKLTEDEAASIGQASEGSLSQARLLAAGTVAPPFEALFQDWMRACYRGQLIDIQDMAERFAKLGREAQKAFISYALTQFRQILRYRYAPDMPGDTPGQLVKGLSARIPPEALEAIVEVLEGMYLRITRNLAPKLLMQSSSIRITQAMGRPLAGRHLARV